MKSHIHMKVGTKTRFEEEAKGYSEMADFNNLKYFKMCCFDSLNLRKISDFRSFSDLKTLIGYLSFSHSRFLNTSAVALYVPLKEVAQSHRKLHFRDFICPCDLHVG